MAINPVTGTRIQRGAPAAGPTETSQAPYQPTFKRELRKGIRRGVGNVGVLAQNALAAGQAAAGFEEAAQENLDEAQAFEQTFAADTAPRVGKLEDIRTDDTMGFLEDATDYLAQLVGSQAPIMGVMAAGGIVGGVARGAAGATIGAGAGSTALETGSIFGDIAKDPEATGTLQEQAGLSLAGGAVAGSLDALPVFRAYRALGAANPLERSIISRAAREAVPQAGLEAITEGAQTLVERGTHRFVNKNFEVLGPEGASELLNAMAAGAILGGGMGAVTGALQRNPTEEDLIDGEIADEVTNKVLLERRVEALRGSRPDQELDALLNEPVVDDELLDYVDSITPQEVKNAFSIERLNGLTQLAEQHPLDVTAMILRGAQEGRSSPEEIALANQLMQQGLQSDSFETRSAMQQLMKRVDAEVADAQVPAGESYDETTNEGFSTLDAVEKELGDTEYNAQNDTMVQRGRQNFAMDSNTGTYFTTPQKIDALRAEQGIEPRNFAITPVEDKALEIEADNPMANVRVVDALSDLQERAKRISDDPAEQQNWMEEQADRLAATRGVAYDAQNPLSIFEGDSAIEVTYPQKEISGADETAFTEQDLAVDLPDSVRARQAQARQKINYQLETGQIDPETHKDKLEKLKATQTAERNKARFIRHASKSGDVRLNKNQIEIEVDGEPRALTVPQVVKRALRQVESLQGQNEDVSWKKATRQQIAQAYASAIASLTTVKRVLPNADPEKLAYLKQRATEQNSGPVQKSLEKLIKRYELAARRASAQAELDAAPADATAFKAALEQEIAEIDTVPVSIPELSNENGDLVVLNTADGQTIADFESIQEFLPGAVSEKNRQFIRFMNGIRNKVAELRKKKNGEVEAKAKMLSFIQGALSKGLPTARDAKTGAVRRRRLTDSERSYLKRQERQLKQPEPWRLKTALSTWPGVRRRETDQKPKPPSEFNSGYEALGYPKATDVSVFGALDEITFESLFGGKFAADKAPAPSKPIDEIAQLSKAAARKEAAAAKARAERKADAVLEADKFLEKGKRLNKTESANHWARIKGRTNTYNAKTGLKARLVNTNSIIKILIDRGDLEALRAINAGTQQGLTIGETVWVNPLMSIEAQQEVLAHEFGHVLARVTAPENKKAVVDAWDTWRQDVKNKGKLKDAAQARRTIALAIDQFGYLSNTDLNNFNAQEQEYILDFEEWFADQTAQWLINTQTKPKTAIGRWMKKFTEGADALFTEAKANDAVVDENVQVFIEKIINTKQMDQVRLASETKKDVRHAAFVVSSDPTTRYGHEAILSMIESGWLTGAPLNALARVFATNSVVNRRIQDTLRPFSPAAAEMVRTDMNTAVAYGYQLWHDGALGLGPAGQSAFDNFTDNIRRAVGEVGAMEQAKNVAEQVKVQVEAFKKQNPLPDSEQLRVLDEAINNASPTSVWNKNREAFEAAAAKYKKKYGKPWFPGDVPAARTNEAGRDYVQVEQRHEDMLDSPRTAAEQAAERAFRDFTPITGRLKGRISTGGSSGYVVSQVLKDTRLQRIAQNSKEVWNRYLGDKINALFTPAVRRMVNTGNAALAEIAKRFLPVVGTHASNEGYLQARSHQISRFLDKFSRALGGKIEPEVAEQVLKHLQQATNLSDIADANVRQIVNDVRGTFQVVHEYAKRGGVNLPKRKKYFPWVYDQQQLAERKDEWVAMMTDAAHDVEMQKLLKKMQEQGINEGSTDPEKPFQSYAEIYNIEDTTDLADFYHSLLIGNEGYADASVAAAEKQKRAVRSGVELVEGKVAHTPYVAALNARGLNFLQALATPELKDMHQSFLVQDLNHALRAYTEQIVKRVEFNRQFNIRQDGTSDLDYLMAQAKDLGATEDELKMAQNFIDGAQGTLGRDTNAAIMKFIGGDVTEGQVINPKLQTAFSVAILWQNLRVLSMAAFSSLADPVGILVRGGSTDVAMAALKASFKINDTSVHSTAVAHALGIVEEYAVDEALASTFGTNFMVGKTRLWNERFFHWIQLNRITRISRAAATGGALQFLKHHKGGKDKLSERFLDELNLKSDDIKLTDAGDVMLLTEDQLTQMWAKVGSTSYNESTKAELRKEIDRDARVRSAIRSFVDQSILRPSAATRPIWASDPHFQLVFHLKSFMYTFHDVILRRVYNEAIQGNFVPAAMLLAFVPIMLFSDYARDLVRFGGVDPKKADWGIMDWTARAIERTGMYGLGQIAVDASQDRQYGGLGVESFLGPTISSLRDVDNIVFGPNNTDAVIKQLPLQNTFLGVSAREAVN